VVGNLRNQAAHITDLVVKTRANRTWQEQAAEQIRTVQTAGNALEERVRQIGEGTVRGQQEQEAKNVAVKELCN
jgi:hypothetical protein